MGCEAPAVARAELARALADDARSLLQAEAHRTSCQTSQLERESPARAPEPPERAIVARDAALARLESCTGLPAGFVRALRANLALPCADTLAAAPGPVTGGTVSAPLQHALFGLALAAQLLRFQVAPPAFRPAFAATSRSEARPFVEHTLLPWVEQRWRQLDEPRRLVELLPASSYGGAIARLGYATAERRVRGAPRTAPIPNQLKKSYELRESYYKTVDELAQPLWSRPRAFSAFDAWATTGQLRSLPELDWTDNLAGRLGALEHLLLPPPELPNSTTESELLAAALPPFFTSELFTLAELSRTDMLRAAALQGLSPVTRGALARASLDDSGRVAWVRSQLILALVTASPERARKVAALSGAAASPSPPLQLMGAVASAFGSLGPDQELQNARESSRAAELAPLLALAKGSGVHAAMAAFAAYDLAMLPVPLAPEALESARSHLTRGAELLPPDLPQACFWDAQGQSSGVLGVPRCPCPFNWRR
jgi:hypothetical protein